MASAAQTAAGSKLYVSASLPATYDKAGFEALTWTEIGEVTTIPSHGATYNIVTHSPLATRQIIKRKGSFDNGTLEVPYAYDIDETPDAGQALISSALNDDDSYSFWVDIKQKKAHYFTAVIAGNPTEPGGVDSIIMKTVSVAIDDNVLEVAAPV